MSRYIDADSLYRRVKEKTNPYGKPTLDYESGVKVLRMIENEPTADVVEVVRCKDCKWCEITKYNDGEVEYGCDCVGGLNCAEADTFCSYGERKER